MHPWCPSAAKKLLQATIRGWLTDAAHLKQNLADYASSEEEFVLGLVQGIGLSLADAADEVAEITGEDPVSVEARWAARLV